MDSACPRPCEGGAEGLSAKRRKKRKCEEQSVHLRSVGNREITTADKIDHVFRGPQEYLRVKPRSVQRAGRNEVKPRVSGVESFAESLSGTIMAYS